MSVMEGKLSDRGKAGKEHGHGPWMHVIGFVISIILTLAALWLVLSHAMRPEPLFATIMILAVLQILVQLFFFMHILDRRGPAWHVWMLMLAFVFAFVVIAGSIWIMTFGTGVTF
ncbi:cytochrome o ubiquinol oxidase subunit IV [Alicyclobacillus herbarius]|uniref:cytochrome o ubiquinol oxidase subunit IV n=1 Tax=Alicyclobacillus herbarius TaxID=122960 RepID=UPI0023564375|nr:cytochrome C oxidase subunit IV family protein [Alicyclobacillus herbarius]